MPYTQIADFLKAAQEIPERAGHGIGKDDKKWIMKAARSGDTGARGTYHVWLRDGWSSFVDLIKVSTYVLFERLEH
jgi:hydroxymethylglutaryl-CoA reductase (NADPH)